MAADLILAVLHHLAAFGLVALLMGEGILIRGDLDARQLDRLARIDRAYGGAAAVLIVVGVLRVLFGAKGYQYYLENPWFWAKMASFAAVAILSIPPTLKVLAWRRAFRADPGFLLAAGEVRAVRRYLRAESLFMVLILVFAATMARIG